MAVAVQPEFSLSVRPFVGVRQPGSGDLHRHDVHVWLMGSNDAGIDLSDYWRVLSADETERAGRFHFEGDRALFVRTRGSLRLLLEGYLGIPAREIVFAFSSHGKPSLNVGTEGLEFNVSHTKGMAVIGFSRECRIGVDVENVRADFKTDEVAERFFSPAERAALRNIPPDHRYQAFFRIWTRKEAYIKALGEGLSHPLHQFDVSVDDTAALLATRPDAAERQRWRLENVAVPPGFVAAVAVETAGVSSAAS